MSKSWGTELWDQFSNLEKFTEKGIDFVEKYNNFIKERQKIELDYAAQLKKLVKNFSPRKREEEDYKAFSSLKTFRGVLGEVGSIANQHELIAENMTTSVVKELMKLHSDLKKERKDYLQEAKQAENMMEKSIKKLESCKNSYKHAHDTWLQARALFEKADSDDNRTKAEVEKARATMDQKNQTRESQKNDYIIQLQSTNKEQEQHYCTRLPEVYNKLQAMEEKRITCLGKYYESYADCHKHVLPVITQCLDDIKTKHGQAVQPTLDANKVIENYKSGLVPPEDIPMMDLDDTGRAPINNERDTDSITSHDGAGSLPGRGKPPKKKKKFTVFSSKKGGRKWERGRLSGLWEEPKDFSHLPPNQQKKKLQEKIDELENQIEQEVKGKEAMLKMRDVYTANNSLGDPNSVNRQLETIGKKIDNLRMELNTYKEYKDKADGKIPTSNQSTPQKVSPVRNSHGKIETVKSPGGDAPSPRNSPSKQPDPRPLSSTTSPLEHGDSFFDEDEEFGDDEEVGEAVELTPVGQCVALYEFESGDPNLLNMDEGEKLDIIEEDSGDGWTRVRRANKTEGYVPTSYIDKP